jgi:hypothetical protein
MRDQTLVRKLLEDLTIKSLAIDVHKLEDNLIGEIQIYSFSFYHKVIITQC